MQLETNYKPCKSLKRPKRQKGNIGYPIKPTRIRTNRTKGDHIQHHRDIDIPTRVSTTPVHPACLTRCISVYSEW